jgi:ADP-heptose:LPS heptosyltransferase
MSRTVPGEQAGGKRRLAVAFAGIGDLVIMEPLFRRLAEGTEFELLTRPYGKQLFRGQSFVKAVHTLGHPMRGARGLGGLLLGGHRRRLAAELAARGIDEVITVSQERSVITDWVDGWLGDGKRRSMAYPELDPNRLELALKSLGMDPRGGLPPPRLDLSGEDRARAHARLRTLGERVVGVQTSAGHVRGFRKRRDMRYLPPERWAEILTHLLENKAADAVVFHGAAGDSVTVPPILERVPSRFRSCFHDWTGAVDIHELKALLAESYALLSVNTGPAHIAAAVGCPLLVFFGPSDPRSYLMKGRGPVELVLGSAPCQYCMGTRAFRDCSDNRCMQSITAEQIREGWRRLQERIEATPGSQGGGD